MINKPTEIALHGADYLDFANKGVPDYDLLTINTKNFVSVLENELAAHVTLLGTGPGPGEIVDKAHRRKKLVVAQRSEYGFS
jgi:adenylosuccinate synthase